MEWTPARAVMNDVMFSESESPSGVEELKED
jgi:hypothetical protein